MATGKGGDKLQKALGEIGRALSGASVVRIGFLAGATYPNGTPVAMIAAINEFGKPPTQPPRPYFRNMIADKKGEWPAAIAGQLKANNYDAAKTLELTGQAVAGQLRASITALVAPPLAQSTIRRKGFDKPLIDTGHMLQSVDYEVKV